MRTGPAPVLLDVALPRTAAAAATAREHVQASFGDVMRPERFADVQLAVTELVANAVKHGTGDIRLRLRIEDGRLYGEVIDEGGGFEHAVRERNPSEVTGRGLGIVATLADAWGIHDGSTHVWFALRLSGAATAATDPQLGDGLRPHGLA
jgi:anti-sigma regulatory factor (Ser/Thr protein kinase)